MKNNERKKGLDNIDLVGLNRIFDKKIEAFLNMSLEEKDLTGQQGRLLFYINYACVILKKEIHQNDLEKRFNLSKSTVSGLVSRLEKKGFIKRVNKGNYVLIYPTEKTEEVVNHFLKVREDMQNKILMGIPKEDIETTNKTLRQLIINLEKEEEEKDV